MSRSYDIPKEHLEIVGKKVVFSGGLFSGKREEPEAEYDVHDIRWGEAQVINIKEMRETGKSSYCHPTVEYLISNSSMKRKRWTRGFAVREINFNDVKSDEEE